MIRFEILLPLFYNNGRPIEPEKFLATDDEIVQAFGATSTDQAFFQQGIEPCLQRLDQ
jgi:hypothetical protein